MAKYKNESGNKYSRLSVLKYAGNDKSGTAKWLCLCDCGKNTTVLGSQLRNGHTKSCGCLSVDIATARMKKGVRRGMTTQHHLIGKRFGRLVVLDECRRDEKLIWRCECDCGKEHFTISAELNNGHVKSCGCLAADATRERFSTHSLSSHPLYDVWCGIKERCCNINNKSYQYYGARGVTICDEWKHDFVEFYNWATTNGYKKGLQIDRENTKGSYTPGNCRFITQKSNMQNQLTSRIWLINGKMFHSHNDAGKHIGVSMETIRNWCKTNVPLCYSVMRYKNG